MAPRDDWTMGLLADQGAYRGDYPEAQWPPSPVQPPARLPDAGQAQMGAIANTMRRAVDPVLETFRAPANLARENSYPPGSEEWQHIENVKADRASNFAGDWALNLLAPARLGGGVRGGLGIGGGKIAQPEGIRAYHSSPHDFERFDASKIGTGEGAQVYGHGIYFAENPAVSGQGGEYWRSFANRFGGSEGNATQRLMDAGFDRQKAVQSVLKDIEAVKALTLDKMFTPEARQSAIALLQGEQRLLESGKPVGPRTYEVNIKARPEQMLDWDRPLAQQSPQARDAIEQVWNANKLGWNPDNILRAVAPEMSGQGLYGSLEASKYQIGQGRGGGKAEASAAFREAGIPGIRYLDQGSRVPAQLDARIDVLRKDLASGLGDHRPMLNRLESLLNERSRYGDPTSNYVIFPGNEHLIDIMKKYGIAGAAPAGLGAIASQSEYQQ